MAMIQIVTAAGIVNAEIIKGFLSGFDIEAKYGPASNGGNKGTGGPNMSQTVFVPEEKAEEALKLLREQELIK